MNGEPTDEPLSLDKARAKRKPPAKNGKKNGKRVAVAGRSKNGVKLGRPSVLDQEIIILGSVGPDGRQLEQRYTKRSLIIDVVRRGANRVSAAGMARVKPSTFRQWLMDARRGKEPFSSFLTDLEAAEEEAVVKAEMDIFMEKDWRAKEAWLRIRLGRLLESEELDRIARDYGMDRDEVAQQAETIGLRIRPA